MRSLLVVVCISLLFACGGGKEYWAAQPTMGPISIQPEQVWVHGSKLWVRTNVVNGTDQPIMINRDLIIARLPSGAVVHRASGSATIHAPYVVPPGASHQVYVEFLGEGFDWHDVPGAQIDFSPGVTVNGQPVQVPPLAVANR